MVPARQWRHASLAILSLSPARVARAEDSLRSSSYARALCARLVRDLVDGWHVHGPILLHDLRHRPLGLGQGTAALRGLRARSTTGTGLPAKTVPCSGAEAWKRLCDAFRGVEETSRCSEDSWGALNMFIHLQRRVSLPNLAHRSRSRSNAYM